MASSSNMTHAIAYAALFRSAGLAAILGLASAYPAAHATPNACVACVFTASQLSKLTGDPLREPEIRKPTARYSVNCAFESETHRGKKVFVTVRTLESRAEFEAFRRLAFLTNKDTFTEINGAGQAAFLTPYAMRAWNGTSALSIKGMKDLLSREITPAEATAMMQLGLQQLPLKP